MKKYIYIYIYIYLVYIYIHNCFSINTSCPKAHTARPRLSFHRTVSKSSVCTLAGRLRRSLPKFGEIQCLRWWVFLGVPMPWKSRILASKWWNYVKPATNRELHQINEDLYPQKNLRCQHDFWGTARGKQWFHNQQMSLFPANNGGLHRFTWVHHGSP